MDFAQLLTLTPEDALAHPDVVEGQAVYGVEVHSADDVSAPAWLKEIGLILKIQDDGDIDTNVLDVVISYRLADIGVLVEVPFALTQRPAWTAHVNVDYLLSVASNVGFAWSFLPPDDDDEAAWAAYTAQQEALMGAYLNKPTFDQFVLPVSSYLEYLMVEQQLGTAKAARFKPEDPYILQRYATHAVARTDAMKAHLRAKVYDLYGSREAFETTAAALMTRALQEAEQVAGQVAQDVRRDRDAFLAQQAAHAAAAAAEPAPDAGSA